MIDLGEHKDLGDAIDEKMNDESAEEKGESKTKEKMEGEKD